jgi:hypothetical protein
MLTRLTLMLAVIALAACNEEPPPATNIQVRAEEQDQLHKLDAINLAIGLKRAIYDAGFTCKQITDAGFVGQYQNLDQWAAHCTDGKSQRDWAIFAGPDGSAQVRDCKDLKGLGLPECVIRTRPKGKFSQL